jgi:erythromycin esterase
MSKAFLLICLFIAPFVSIAQTPFLKDHTQKIQTDGNGHFSNLDVLNPPLAGVQVVTLGEQTHFDGATFDAKIQLIKYLHEVLGFNVLAFESGYYDCTKAGQMLANNPVNGTLRDAVFGVWYIKALSQLEQYIIATQKTAQPLRITGFDAQFSGKLSGKYLLADLENYLNQIGEQKMVKKPEWDGFKSAVQRQIKYSNFYKKPSTKDTLLIGQVCRQITMLLESKAASLDKDERYLWKRVLANLVFDTKHRYTNNNYRDSVMGLNLLSLITERYPEEKVICWGATSHFIYNPKAIQSKNYEAFIPMGNYLHQKLKKSLFTIAFTSYKGKAGSMITHQLKVPSEDSYEGTLGKAGFRYAFTNFRDVPFEKKKYTKTRLLGNKFQSMVLSEVIDAMFYIETAYPPK